MTPAKWNPQHILGTDFYEEFTAADEDGAAIDFTNYTGDFYLWDRDGEEVLHVTTGGTEGNDLVFTSSGFNLTIAEDVLAGIGVGCFGHRLFLQAGPTDSGALTGCWLEGQFDIKQQEYTP